MEKVISGYLDGKNIRSVARLLREGGVAVLPTDTIYGFHCVVSDPAAAARIRSLKGERSKPGFILLVSRIGMADSLVDAWPPGVREKLKEIWPSPVTVVLSASASVPANIAPGGKVALRMPAETGLLKVISVLDSALVSTSVNKSGHPPMRRIKEIRKAFPTLGAYISKRGRHARSPSTIIDMTSTPFRILREGGFPKRKLEKLLAH